MRRVYKRLACASSQTSYPVVPSVFLLTLLLAACGGVSSRATDSRVTNPQTSLSSANTSGAGGTTTGGVNNPSDGGVSGANTITTATFLTVTSPTATNVPKGTTLAALAAQLKLGTWAELKSQGFGPAILDDVNGSFIIQYTDDAQWDPVSKQVFFIGASYGFSSGAQRGNFIKYNDAANQWTLMPRPVGPFPNLAHAYDHSALNPATGEFYHSLYNNRDIYKYNPAADSWSLLTTIPQSIMGGLQITKGLEYFPEMGGLVWYSSGVGLYFFNTSTKQWSVLADGLGTSTYHEFSEYDPVHKIVIFGGGDGSNAVFKLDASGKVTQMKNAPVGLGITQSIITVDPVSGKFLVVTENKGLYEYDVVADTWRQFNVPVPSGFFSVVIDGNPLQGMFATPISTYGVVLFAKYNYDQSKVWIYKHSAP